MRKCKAVFYLLTLALTGCAHRPTRTQPPPPPRIESAKPGPRLIRAGDYILKGAEILPDGTVVCHKAIQVIDSTKRHEDVTTYKCR